MISHLAEPFPAFSENDSIAQTSQNKLRLFDGVDISITRYHFIQSQNIDESGYFRYNFIAEDSFDNNIVLEYFILSNNSCGEECHYCNNQCKQNSIVPITVCDKFRIIFKSSYFSNLLGETNSQDYKNRLISFKICKSFTRQLVVCKRKKNVLEAIQNQSFTGGLRNVFINAKLQDLLILSLECLDHKIDETVFCKFLDNVTDREKILKARDILIQNIGSPITIKDLSKKVAINECYLKKGFKAIFGTTIFDFYQQKRMEHARYLLFQKGLSVTEVAYLLGYSSISHFSSAFKKLTGIKPCELLN